MSDPGKSVTYSAGMPCFLKSHGSSVLQANPKVERQWIMGRTCFNSARNRVLPSVFPFQALNFIFVCRWRITPGPGSRRSQGQAGKTSANVAESNLVMLSLS